MEDKALVRIDRRVINLEEDAMSVDRLVAQASLIQDVMKKIMKVDEHYGTIPGTKKPMLYKAGAEKLGVVFRLIPEFHIEIIDLPGGHRECRSKCVLTHGPTGMIAGECTASCSTLEAKYRYRKAERQCPACGSEAIIKSKAEFGGGWLCFEKRGGCGARYDDGDPAIEEQIVGRVEHDNVGDYYNTILKIAEKRSHTGAITLATGASDIFAPATDEPDDEMPRTRKTMKHQPPAEDRQPITLEQVAASVAKMKHINAIGELSAYWNTRRKSISHDRSAVAAEDEAFKARLVELKNNAAAQKKVFAEVTPKTDPEYSVPCPPTGKHEGAEVKRKDCEAGCEQFSGCPAWVE